MSTYYKTSQIYPRNIWEDIDNNNEDNEKYINGSDNEKKDIDNNDSENDDSENDSENEDLESDSDSSTDSNDGIEYEDDEIITLDNVKKNLPLAIKKSAPKYYSNQSHFKSMTFNVEYSDDEDENENIIKWKKPLTTSEYSSDTLINNYEKKNEEHKKDSQKLIRSINIILIKIFNKIVKLEDKNLSIENIDDVQLSKKFIETKSVEILSIIHEYENDLTKNRIYFKNLESNIKNKKNSNKSVYAVRCLNSILFEVDKKLILTKGKNDYGKEIPSEKRWYSIKYIS